MKEGKEIAILIKKHFPGRILSDQMGEDYDKFKLFIQKLEYGPEQFTTLDLVRKLIGPIDPAGESSIDRERFKNLNQMCELVLELINDIRMVTRSKDNHQASMRDAGRYAHKFLTEELNIKDEE